MDEIFRVFRRWCKESEKSIVLMIDEVDTAANNQVFMDFLAQLRSGYLRRGTIPFFQTVILAGVTDVKHLKAKIRPEEAHRAVYVGSDTLRLTGGTLTNCYAPQGAGVYQGGGNFYFTGGSIDGCVAASTSEAVEDSTTTVSLDSGVAAGRGGGVYLASGNFYMQGSGSGGTISGCKAVQYGGGVYLGGGAFTFTGGLIGVTKATGIVEYADSAAGNNAQYGGGIYVAANANVSIVGGKVSGNRATKLGGGIAPGNADARLYFAGSIQVFDNFLDPSEDRCDVSLDYDTEKVINTTEDSSRQPGAPESQVITRRAA